MTTYIANKPCRFGDKSYLIGEKIPADKILSRRIGSLLRMGVIVEGEEEKPVQKPKIIPQAKDDLKEKAEK